MDEFTRLVANSIGIGIFALPALAYFIGPLKASILLFLAMLASYYATLLAPKYRDTVSDILGFGVAIIAITAYIVAAALHLEVSPVFIALFVLLSLLIGIESKQVAWTFIFFSLFLAALSLMALEGATVDYGRETIIGLGMFLFASLFAFFHHLGIRKVDKTDAFYATLSVFFLYLAFTLAIAPYGPIDLASKFLTQLFPSFKLAIDVLALSIFYFSAIILGNASRRVLGFTRLQHLSVLTIGVLAIAYMVEKLKITFVALTTAGGALAALYFAYIAWRSIIKEGTKFENTFLLALSILPFILVLAGGF